MTINLKKVATQLADQFSNNAPHHDEAGTFAKDNYAALRQQKVFSALVPKTLGGGGASYQEMCDFVRNLAQACPSTALSLSMHQHLTSAAVVNDAAGRPGRKLLEKIAGGDTVLISTGANDWLESNGMAQRVEGGFEITAVKPFASGSPDGDVLVTSCAYDDPNEGPQVLHFPVPLKSEGIQFLDDWQTFGMRGTGSQTIRLENVFVPDAAIALRRSRGGYHPAFSVILSVALPLIMSAYTGVAEAAASIARDKSSGKSGDPVTPFLLGEMENLLTTAQLAQADMIRMTNNFAFEPSLELANNMLMRKTICANHVIATCEKAMEVVGGASFFRKLGLERLLRDVHASQFHPLPEKRQQMFAGRLAMGLDPVTGLEAPPQPKTA